MVSSFDIAKLSHILKETEYDSDTGSVDSNELEINCELYDILKDDNNKSVKKCQDPLLKRALIYNIKKRRILVQVIHKLETHLKQIKQIYQECRSKIGKKSPRVNFTRKRLGAPYFKDATAFPSPPNVDFLKIRDAKQYVQNDLLQNVWLKEDKYNLLHGVFNDVCSKRFEELNRQMNIIRERKNMTPELIESLEYEINVFSNTQLMDALLKNWTTLHKLILENPKDPDQFGEQLILKTVCEWNKNIDWLKIASIYLDGRHTGVECEAMWNCYINPKFSKDTWKVLENMKLIELTERHNYQNWDIIALELNTHRSGYQCCIHFHVKLCDKFNRDKWTPEEERHLKAVVAKCRVGSYISWGKVAHFYKHRTKIQIYRHYTACMQEPVKKGAFSVQEDILLLTAMKFYNKDMRKIRIHFPNRLPEQLRSRFKTLNANVSGHTWTPQEDAQIIQYVAEHGQKNWKALRYKVHRSEGSIRHRYNVIKKYIEQNLGAGYSVFHVPRRGSQKLKNQLRKRHIFVKKVVSFLVHKLSYTRQISNYLNMEYIQGIMSPFSQTFNNTLTIRKTLALTPEMNIYGLISDYFKSSYKNVVRAREVINDNYINSSADRIQVLLKVLGANLEFPSLNEIINNPLLDSTDIKIITQLMDRQGDSPKNPVPSTSYQQNELSIPPCIENLIGFRGILLHMPVLRNHSRGRYDGYTLYVKTEEGTNYITYGYNYNKLKLELSLSNYDEETRVAVIEERQIFFKRLQLLFKWPLIIADTKSEPSIATLKSEEPKDKLKPGRKPKDVKNYKVKLMNIARKNIAAEKRQLLHGNEDESSIKKIKLGE